MTLIRRTEGCLERFKRDYERGLFSEDDGRVLKIWAREMEKFGHEYIRDSKDWRDHSLTGAWSGYRASCFSSSGQIIYRIINEHVTEVCEVERITPNHQYK